MIDDESVEARRLECAAPDQRPLEFRPRTRPELVLRLAGYSDAQVAKLLARGHVVDEPPAERRRAA